MKPKLTPHAFSLRVLGGTLFLAVVCSIMARSPDRMTYSARLRAQFVAAFGKDFDLVKSEFKTRSAARGGGTFWLAYLAPKRTGYFYLQHGSKPPGKLYSHVEREIHLGVGPKGCRRGPPYAGRYSRFCLGDTIIVPVWFSEFTNNEFKMVKAEYSEGDKDWMTFDELHPESRDVGLDHTPVANPAAESLRYVGRSCGTAPLRSRGYRLQCDAVFEAVKPGRFNLEVSSSLPGATSAVKAGPGVPIIVVARDAPVTMIAGYEDVRGFAMGYDGREWVSSTSGNSYMTNLIILQPGDRISLLYYSALRREEIGRGHRAGLRLSDAAEDIKPAINKSPFSIDAQHEFNEWLIDHLPR